MIRHPHVDLQYQALLYALLVDGAERQDRTGVGTLSLFGRKLEIDLGAGFPLLTTKKLHTRSIVAELAWFLQGLTNNRWLEARGVSIWSEWADANGELGPIYGAQWRSWPDGRGGCIDQIARLVEGIRDNPTSRRHIVSAWNPADIPDMALPPCHCLFQFFVTGDGRLDCQLYQRSADVFLGLPFNIASYALLTCMVAKACGLRPGVLHHVLGDAHLYLNHIEQAREQSMRTPLPLPGVEFSPDLDLFRFDVADVTFPGYEAHPHIPATVAK